jgi:hypothetical protein
VKKMKEKKFALPEKDISTLILFNAFISIVTKYYSSLRGRSIFKKNYKTLRFF